MVTCDKCDQELKLGMWPFCPHGFMTSFGESPMTPHFDEMISSEGKEFRTWGEKIKYMDKHGIVPVDNKDKGTRKGRGDLFLDLGKR